eukprot:403334949
MSTAAIDAQKDIDLSNNDENEVEEKVVLRELTKEEQITESIESINTMLTFLKRLKVNHGLRSIQMARAPREYYAWSLKERKEFLGAPSEYALCKTIIMKNSEYNDEYSNDPFYPRFIMVIVQYKKSLISQNIANIMKDYQRKHTQLKEIGKKQFKYRLADEADAFELSGYSYNSITPFFMKNDKLLIILSDDIVKLNPGYFWLGGGRVELKIGVSVEEFMQFFGNRVITGSISRAKQVPTV